MQILFIYSIPLLLLGAALFAASEASIFSLSRSKLEALRASKPMIHKRIKALTDEPDSLLSTIIIGNECLNILIGTLIATLLQLELTGWDPSYVTGISVLVTTVLLLTFSEILPKILAFRMPTQIAAFIALPMTIAHKGLTPFRVIFLSVSRYITSLLGIESKPPAALSEKDLLTLVEAGFESGSLGKDEQKLISNVFHFSDLSVSAVMTPWAKTFSIWDTDKVEEIRKKMKLNRYSRIPVLSKKTKKVVGILYTRELIRNLLSTDSKAGSKTIQKAIAPPYIVSAHKKVSFMFRDFKSKKIHIALVVDEFGNHIGIVTLDDLLNALFSVHKKVEGTTP